MSFDSILVANRGEIACRIIATAKRLGLKSIAVYSEPDRSAPHVRLADNAVAIGTGPARDSYLRQDRVLEAALANGAGAIHPGYGFLSENAEFARSVELSGLAFVGPTPQQLAIFGQKHTAREAAIAVGVPLLPGSGLLHDLEVALSEAERIGWPVMLKATSGGGGIGMQVCRDEGELKEGFAAVVRAATSSFGSGEVYLEAFVEHARHVEVQLFGDGLGHVQTLGDRDCSLQRRNQKVVEEAPAPRLPESVRRVIHRCAVELGESVNYRSAGTVEYIYDDEREQAFFLEMNTRLQVEHGVTESIYGVDLVEWMLRLSLGDRSFLEHEYPSSGHSIEARIYAEDSEANFQPSAGLLTEVSFPATVRVDSWIESGTEVSAFYDPLLAKIISHGETREAAIEGLSAALLATRVEGIVTNIGFVVEAIANSEFVNATHSTMTLGKVSDPRPRLEVISPGAQTTVQDWPGRLGYWSVGVPPSGPMDDLSFRLGNIAVGNDPGAAGFEAVLSGPTLRANVPAVICITGARSSVLVDGRARPMWEPFVLSAGETLEVGEIGGPGMRAYILVGGGVDTPRYLGSTSTFTLGHFGGHGGRVLRSGDVIWIHDRALRPGLGRIDPVPVMSNEWNIEVLEGPHGAPEFFTEADIEMLYATPWEVHFNSARTGVRLIGPRPSWARTDGGEAGLHPSNIHDTPYATATIDFTGDTPILLGPDGPSLGGFVCPATIALAERWKLGQLRPGDRVRFVPITTSRAKVLRDRVRTALRAGGAPPARSGPRMLQGDGGILGRREGETDRPEVTYRRQGDDNLLIEYGPMKLDIGLRIRVQSLLEKVSALSLRGVIDLTPGIRSLQMHVDPDRLALRDALKIVSEIEDLLPQTSDLSVDSRTISLPLSWDDPGAREATARYMAGVRDDAPWCPSNIEFIRRINGLRSVDEVREIVHEAEYLVLGLGDVYLGAPVATPLDPRHRLVTTKYNPARTWTPENAVGIGGAYLCIYGMEGPGGYQLIGRTVQVWSRWHTRAPFADGVPWLLRHFDRIRWYRVEPEELLEARARMSAGAFEVDIEPGRFSLSEHEAMLARNADSIRDFQDRQRTAFEQERGRWEIAGEFDRVASAESNMTATVRSARVLASGETAVGAPMTSSVYQVHIAPGEEVEVGDVLCTLEAMKLEVPVVSPIAGVVGAVLVRAGDQVLAGSPILVLRAREGEGDECDVPSP